MTTLSQLLIEANITPDMFAKEVKYIAQDYSETAYTYEYLPLLEEEWKAYRYGGICYTTIGTLDTNCIALSITADDWETPLSIEDFKNAYGHHIQTLAQEHDDAPTQEEVDYHTTQYEIFVKDPQEFSHMCIDDLLKKEKELDDEIKVLENKRCKIVDALNERVKKYGKTINNTF